MYVTFFIQNKLLHGSTHFQSDNSIRKELGSVQMDVNIAILIGCMKYNRLRANLLRVRTKLQTLSAMMTDLQIRLATRPLHNCADIETHFV